MRAIRRLVDEALGALHGRFEALYSPIGRPSILPEMLLRAMLLQAFFSVRSERLLMEQIDYNPLFRWFVGQPMDAAVWHPKVFTHNRDRLLEAEVVRKFRTALMMVDRRKRVRRMTLGADKAYDATTFIKALRKRIEEVFGWIKAQAGLKHVKVQRLAKVESTLTFSVAAYNLIRIPKLRVPASV